MKSLGKGDRHSRPNPPLKVFEAEGAREENPFPWGGRRPAIKRRLRREAVARRLRKPRFPNPGAGDERLSP